MARMGNSTTRNNSSANTKVEPYFKRLDPMFRDRVADDGSGEPLVDVRVFDDRADVGQKQPGVIAQLFSMYADKDTGKPRVGKGFSITATDGQALRDLAGVFNDAADAVEAANAKATASAGRRSARAARR